MQETVRMMLKAVEDYEAYQRECVRLRWIHHGRQ